MQTLGSRQASNTFGNLLDTVQQGGSVKVTRHHKDVAVILSVEDYQLLGGEPARLHKRSELFEQKRRVLLAELQKGMDDLNSGRCKEATPEFWRNLKRTIAA